MFHLKKLLLFLILTSSSVVLGQIKDYKDQFKLILKKKAIEYKTETNFNKAQSFYNDRNWDSTLVFSMKQLISNSKELADYCHFLRGYSFQKIELHKEAEKEYNQISNKFKFYPLVNYQLGFTALTTNKIPKAIDYYLKADSALVNKPYQLKNIYSNIAICYLHLKQYQKAEEFFTKNNKLLLSKRDNSSLYDSYTNIANLYYEQYKDKEAIAYFEKAYTLSKNIKDFGKKAEAHSIWQL